MKFIASYWDYIGPASGFVAAFVPAAVRKVKAAWTSFRSAK